MKTRLVVIVALAALFSSFLVVPAGAANFSTNTNVVNDAGTDSPWAGTETFGASAYDTSVVTPDVSAPAGGTFTYVLFSDGTCDGTPITTQTVSLNGDGSVPNSDPTSNLDAGTYSYDATYNGDDGINDPSSGLCASFTIAQATPSPAPSIANLPSNATWSSGGGFTATLNATDSDGVQSVTSSTTDVCTASGLTVTYVTAGTCTLTAQTAAGTDYIAASGSQQSFTIGQATPSPTPSIANLPSNATWSSGGGFTATLNATDSDGVQSVTSSTTDVCTASGLTVTYVTAGNCTLTAQTAASTDYIAASGTQQTFTIGRATPSPAPSITNIPTNAIWSSGGGFTATLNATDSDGAQSVTSSTTGVCTASGLTVTYVTAGNCTLTAHTAASTDYAAASGTQQTFTIGQATPSPAPSISNLPSNPTWSSGGGFTATLNAISSDGAQSVTSSTTSVCTASGLTVTYVTAGTCTLTAQTAASTDFAAASGTQQTFTIGQATPSPAPSITNIPTNAIWSSGGGFTAHLRAIDSDGAQSVTSSTTSVCTASGLTGHLRDRRQLHLDRPDGGEYRLRSRFGRSADLHDRSGNTDRADDHEHPLEPDLELWRRFHRSARQQRRQRRDSVGDFEHHKRLHHQWSPGHLCDCRHLHLDGPDGGHQQLRRRYGQSADLHDRPGDTVSGAVDLQHALKPDLELGRWVHCCIECD